MAFWRSCGVGGRTGSGGTAIFFFLAGASGLALGAGAFSFVAALGVVTFEGAFFSLCPGGLDAFAAGFFFFAAAGAFFTAGFFDAALGAGFLVAFGFDANRAWLWDDFDLVFKQLYRWSLSLKGPRNIRYKDF